MKNKHVYVLLKIKETKNYSVCCHALELSNFMTILNSKAQVDWILAEHIVTVCVFVCHMFSYHPFYFDFHSARVTFDVSSGFYFWNVNRIPTWHLLKMFKVAFKDVSTKNSEPSYWTILFVMLKIYFIYKVAGKKSTVFGTYVFKSKL